jgi:hypothetical protein
MPALDVPDELTPELRNIRTAALAYANARRTHQELEDRRPLLKHNSVVAIMEERSISYTQAERLVEGYPLYENLLAARRDALHAELLAEAEYLVAKLHATRLRATSL